MLKTKIYAFVMGVVEFRSDFTMNFEDGTDAGYDAQDCYEKGRQLAHAATFHKFN